MKKEWYICILASIISLQINYIFAQPSAGNLNSFNQQWLQYYQRLKLSDRVVLTGDGSVRWKDSFGSFTQLLVRAGCGYNIKKRLSVSGGFAYLLSYNDHVCSIAEFRVWQEVMYQRKFNRFIASSRFRLEDRFLKKGINQKLSESVFYYRVRFRLYTTIPLNHPIVSLINISIHAGNEIFYNFGKECKNSFFDNNRLLGGVSYQLNTSWSLALHYVFQYSKKGIPDTYEKSNILWLSVTSSI